MVLYRRVAGSVAAKSAAPAGRRASTTGQRSGGESTDVGRSQGKLRAATTANARISAALRAGTPACPAAADDPVSPTAGASFAVGRRLVAGSLLSPQASSGAITSAHQIVLRTACRAR